MSAATTNVREFNLSLDAFMKLVPAKAKKVQQKLALDALAGVVKKSPVDTGRFRANWHISVSSPSDRTTAEVDKRRRGSGPGGEFKARSEAALETVGDWDIVYLQNALPYAQALEDGHSGQAPGGMIALTYAELNAAINREIYADEQAALARALGL